MDWKTELLAAHAVGALEPGAQVAAEALLRRDPSAGFALGGIEALTGVRRTGPMPGMLAASAEPAPLLGASGSFRVGDRVSLRLEAPVPLPEARCVLFRVVGGSSRLIHPRAPFPWPTLDRFRADGRNLQLDLVLELPVDLHRYELILVPATVYQVAWPAHEPLWGEVRDAFRRGRLPGAVFELKVEGLGGGSEEGVTGIFPE